MRFGYKYGCTYSLLTLRCCAGWGSPATHCLSKIRYISSLYAVSPGRSIPYAETYEEQQIRQLWENKPFSTAESVVDSVLKNQGFTDISLLQRLDQPSCSKPSGYEEMFEPIYGVGLNFRDVWKPPTEFSYKDKRRHFLVQVAYRGGDFCGWQTQPNNHELPSVQKTLEEWLAELEGDKVNLRVCGRTDAGVHAIGQVCRFRSRNQEMTAMDVEQHLQQIPSLKSVGCTQVLQVTKAFHPSFAATCRAYTYLVDVDARDELDEDKVGLLDQMLQTLEGKELDFIGLSYGRLKTQTSLCTLRHARACLVQDSSTNKQAICIELVGDRFLRRMIRILVETSLRIVQERTSPSPDALLHHIDKRDRQLIRTTAPPDGLIFVGARFQKI
jgi:tRNA pseudouridine38-40 synthase